MKTVFETPSWRGSAIATLSLLVGCLLLNPLSVSAQTTADNSSNRVVMKIEESTHALTPANQPMRQIIVSKVYDSGDSLGNSYIVRLKDAKKAIVIDPGYNYEAVTTYLNRLSVDLEAILLTNGHFLRIAGNEELRKKWPDATILIGEKDAGFLTDPKANMSDEFGGVTSPVANVWLTDGKAFEIADIPFSVLSTPGHTPGSMTYVIAADEHPIAFTGDFIYKDGISSANLPSSDEEALQKSLDHFLENQFAETLIFPGYGEDTSVSEFYQQLTGNSIAVIDDDKADNTIIIVERDPATVVVTEPVYIPTIEYRTETVVVDRYVRPWLAVGVSIPLWSHWSWYDYYHHHRPHYRPLPPPPMYRPPYYGNRPPIIPPGPPLRPGQGPNRPPIVIPPGGSRPGPGIPPGPNRPGQGLTPGGNRPGPGITPGPNRPGQGLTPGGNRPPIILPPSGTRPGAGVTPAPNQPGTRPTPGIVGGNQPRPVPGTRPNDRPVPGTRPNDRLIPSTRPTQIIPGTRPGDRPTTPSTRPSTRPTTPTPGTTGSTSGSTSPRPTTPPSGILGGGRPASSSPRPAAQPSSTSSRPTLAASSGGGGRGSSPATRSGGGFRGGPRGGDGERD